jgi:hypothetical protein
LDENFETEVDVCSPPSGKIYGSSSAGLNTRRKDVHGSRFVHHHHAVASGFKGNTISFNHEKLFSFLYPPETM